MQMEELRRMRTIAGYNLSRPESPGPPYSLDALLHKSELCACQTYKSYAGFFWIQHLLVIFHHFWSCTMFFKSHGKVILPHLIGIPMPWKFNIPAIYLCLHIAIFCMGLHVCNSCVLALLYSTHTHTHTKLHTWSN